MPKSPSFFKKFSKELSDKEIAKKYNKLRWHVFIGVIIGYMSFYLLRHNFPLAVPHLIESGLTKTQIGLILSIFPLTYGISRLLMSILSDHGNPKYFMIPGLLLSTIINFAYGSNLVSNSILLMSILMFLNAWAQSMGWPALVKIMVHWFSRKERGTRMSIINAAQNIAVGIIGPLTILGITVFNSWRSIFYFPAIFTSLAILIVFMLIHDKPESKGLPPIEEYENRKNGNQVSLLDPSHNIDATTKQAFIIHILKNKRLWCLAFANMFIYLLSLGILNWLPTYLKEVKGLSANASSMAFMVYEYAGVPGALLCGWLSDTYFHHSRTKIGIFYLLFAFGAVLYYWLFPAHNIFHCNLSLFLTGFFALGPMTLINVYGLDIVPKKLAGAGSGLVGFFGHVGGGILANLGLGYIIDHFKWDLGFIMLLLSCLIAIAFLGYSKSH